MRIEQRRAEFIEKHKNADLLVFDIKTGVPLQAVYNTDDKLQLDEVRAFFAAVVEEENRRAWGMSE